MSARSTGFITIDGIRLEYQWLGQLDPDKPTLVFLHEGLGSVSMWKDFPRQLSETTDLSAFIYSRRGYGKSDPAVLPRDANYMHDEGLDVLPKVLNKMGIARAILIGHSDGGSISLIFAATDVKQRAIGLVLLAPHVFNETLCINSIRKAKELYETTDLRERLAKYHDDVDHSFLGWHDIWLHPDFESWNIEAYLADIDIPILHIQGEDDQYGSMAQADAIKQQSSSPVDVLPLPDCGHSAHFDQADLSVESIQGFIKKYHLLS